MPSQGPPHRSSHLPEVIAVFTRLGFTGFGGPAAHLAMMEDQVVHRRRWIDRTHLLDLIAAINLIPGPNSTQLAIALGYIRAGWMGLIAAGVCFILPAVLIILPLAWLYVAYGTQPEVHQAFRGINAAVVAIIAAALWRFARIGIQDGFTALLAIAAAAAEFLTDPHIAARVARWSRAGAWVCAHLPPPGSEVLILAFAALLGILWYARPAATQAAILFFGPSAGRDCLPLAAIAMSPFKDMTLFFLKVGATLFGSGYVLVSYLQGGLVDQRHWLTTQQLTDAVAVGQVTPGPLLTTATFIGFVLGDQKFGGGVTGGIVGALLATIAIFLPSFLLIATLGPLFPRLRASPVAQGALAGMKAVVVALIFVVAVRLGISTLGNRLDAAIAVVALLGLLIWNANSTWIIIAAGLIGWIGHSLG